MSWNLSAGCFPDLLYQLGIRRSVFTWLQEEEKHLPKGTEPFSGAVLSLHTGSYTPIFWHHLPIFSSVAQLCLTLCDPMDCSMPGLPVHYQLPEFTQTCPLSWWCHLTISSSVIPFSSHLQSFPVSRFFQMSQFFASGGQTIAVSASTSVLPMNIQDWFPLGWIGWISLQSKGLSRVFSNTTVQKHQFFGAQLSPQSNSHIHTWPLEKP